MLLGPCSVTPDVAPAWTPTLMHENGRASTKCSPAIGPKLHVYQSYIELTGVRKRPDRSADLKDGSARTAERPRRSHPPLHRAITRHARPCAGHRRYLCWCFEGVERSEVRDVVRPQASRGSA